MRQPVQLKQFLRGVISLRDDCVMSLCATRADRRRNAAAEQNGDGQLFCPTERDTMPHRPEFSRPLVEDFMSAVTLQDARRVIAAAEKKAVEIGQPMNIAVADEGGNLVAHVRMDDAWIGSIDISIKKAFTSRAFDITTRDLATHSQSGNQFFGIHASNDGRIMIFAGGIPLKRQGKVVGAIGVSGGSGDQDHSVAEAGAAAF
jgi:uncharacterized protein GlcG (DUF336 family)